jgi:hypothetical protein
LRLSSHPSSFLSRSVYFQIAVGVLVKPNSIDNSLRFYLSNGYHIDFDLPIGITPDERHDWIEVLMDCCGFPSRDDAATGNRGPRNPPKKLVR